MIQPIIMLTHSDKLKFRLPKNYKAVGLKPELEPRDRPCS